MKDDYVLEIVDEICKLHKRAYEIYSPIVEDICSRVVSEEELSHCLDYLLGFAGDSAMLGLYKRVCRRYYKVYSDCVVFYINEYREVYDDSWSEDLQDN